MLSNDLNDFLVQLCSFHTCLFSKSISLFESVRDLMMEIYFLSEFLKVVLLNLFFDIIKEWFGLHYLNLLIRFNGFFSFEFVKISIMLIFNLSGGKFIVSSIFIIHTVLESKCTDGGAFLFLRSEVVKHVFSKILFVNFFYRFFEVILKIIKADHAIVFRKI